MTSHNNINVRGGLNLTRKKSIYTLASVYVGTIIGAGFASGQEIIQFFGEFGGKGILGVLVVTILYILLGITILNIVYTKKIRNFEQFAKIYFGRSLYKILNIILLWVLFTSYVVMISGGGAVVYENFDIPYIYGIIGMSLATFIVFIFGVKGIANANKIIVPFLVFIILWVGFNIIYKNEAIFSNFHASYFIDDSILSNKNMVKSFIIQVITELKWLFSAVTYFAHNTIGSTVVMCSLGPLIYDKRSAKLGGMLGGIILGILGLIILLSLLILHSNIIGLEVPMVTVAGNLGKVWRVLYSLVLLLAMFTTAIANGYGCISGLSSLIRVNKKIISILICIISIPLARLGFKNLVTYMYPLFGYIGMILIFSIIIKKRSSYKGFR